MSWASRPDLKIIFSTFLTIHNVQEQKAELAAVVIREDAAGFAPIQQPQVSVLPFKNVNSASRSLTLASYLSRIYATFAGVVTYPAAMLILSKSSSAKCPAIIFSATCSLGCT